MFHYVDQIPAKFVLQTFLGMFPHESWPFPSSLEIFLFHVDCFALLYQISAFL